MTLTKPSYRDRVLMRLIEGGYGEHLSKFEEFTIEQFEDENADVISCVEQIDRDRRSRNILPTPRLP